MKNILLIFSLLFLFSCASQDQLRKRPDASQNINNSQGDTDQLFEEMKDF